MGPPVSPLKATLSQFEVKDMTPWQTLTPAERDAIVIGAMKVPAARLIVNAKLDALRRQTAARKAKANKNKKGGRR